MRHTDILFFTLIDTVLHSVAYVSSWKAPMLQHFFFYGFRNVPILRKWESLNLVRFQRAVLTAVKRVHLRCTKSETCLPRETFNKYVLMGGLIQSVESDASDSIIIN